ncbi:unannotated protein [freshwater metagenome]|uniref:Unannotated protein n=1 Tax=freshwater metagenome TaxID=449393 RepID=A0A6J6XE63_9ZZZZ
MIRELRPIGGHVIEPCADDATDDSPHRNCIGVVFSADATLLEATTHQPHAGHYAERDHQSVGVNIQRPNIERAARWAGEAADSVAHLHHAEITRFAKATASVKMSSLS